MIIEPGDFLAYEDVRQSGVTNMLNVKLVCELSGLTSNQVLEIMKHYTELMEIYG